MKNRKASGEDMIPSELLKYLGDKREPWMLENMNKVRESENVPEAWKKSVICPN